MIIVTGAAGLIGSAIIWELNNIGINDILAVDNLGTKEKWKNLVNLKFQDYLEKDDFLNYIQENKLDASVILHMGACSDTQEMDSTYLIKNNYEYTKQLANFALKNNSRFIYASSAATYGDGSNGYSDNIIEGLKPLNMYGYSKQLFDLWALSKGVIDKMVGLKFFNVYGPNEYHKGDMRSMINKAFYQVQDKGQIKLFKSYKPNYLNGEQKRDFIYVKDAVKMIMFFMHKKDKNGIFNIGTGIERSWNDLANAVFLAMKKTPNIKYVSMPDTLKDKYQYFTKADITKLKTAGYKDKIHTLEEGVEDYIKNYLLTDKFL